MCRIMIQSRPLPEKCVQSIRVVGGRSPSVFSRRNPTRSQHIECLPNFQMHQTCAAVLSFDFLLLVERAGRTIAGCVTHVFLVLGMFTWKPESQQGHRKELSRIEDRTILSVLTGCRLQQSLGGDVTGWVVDKKGQTLVSH